MLQNTQTQNTKWANLIIMHQKSKMNEQVGANDKQAPVNFVMASKYLRLLPTKQNSIWNTETQTHVYELAKKKQNKK